jgi:Tfp pilus assembly protein PilX
MKRLAKINGQRGAVSMLTVIFFMILISVLVISFMRLTNYEATQTSNDELKASALAGANGGIEDAKRVLAYCANDLPAMSDSTNPNSGCYAITHKNVDDQDCNVILSDSRLSGASGSKKTIETTGSSTKNSLEGIVDSSGGNYGQRYTCLKLSTQLTDVEYTLANGQDQILQLKLDSGDATTASNDAVNYVLISWGADDANSKYDSNNTAGVDQLPPYSAATGTWGLPALLRAEVVQVPKNSSSIINDIKDYAASLHPTFLGSPSPGAGTPIHIGNNVNYYYNNISPNQTTNATAKITPEQQVNCLANAINGYNCWAKIYLGAADQDVRYDFTNYDYYMRLTPTYSGANIKVQFMAGSTSSVSPMTFDGVQAAVDVTGRVSDVYQRLTARLNPVGNGDSWYPKYAIESNTKVCKDMSIYAQYGVDDCLN